MDSDKYKVNILHFINPHLIWVLVEKEDEENVYFYEQIGIYGILPLDITIDCNGVVEKKRCEEWLPAVTAAMKTLLLEAKDIWFSVTYLDRTTSIFDNNLHKYGDLIITMKNGKTLSMTEQLLDTGFVAEDVQYFHCNLKTKLDYVTTVSVINKIKQSIKLLNKPFHNLEDKLNRQMSVFQQITEVEEVATINYPDVQLLLHKHVNDLIACKDVDEISAGRANTVKSNLSAALIKKLNLSQSQCNSVVQSSLCTNKEDVNNALHSNYENVNTDSKDHKNKFMASEPTVTTKTNKKAIKLKPKNPDKVKKFVAMGPPGLNPALFHRMELKTEKEEVINKTVAETKAEECQDAEDKDIFNGIDSGVNIKIDNLDSLKVKINYPDVKINESVLTFNKNIPTDGVKNGNDKSHIKSRKIKYLSDIIATIYDSSSTGETDSTVKQGDDSDSDSITSLVDKLDLSNRSIKKEIEPPPEFIDSNVKNNVNPFKNLDGSKSVFVDKLISPTLMVHTKNGNCIQPASNLRDVPFGTDIHVILQNMSVKKPMRPQTVSWPTILRGQSLFLVSPYDSGKTIGYLPAVCRLVSHCKQSTEGLSVAPLYCIILCATGKSVSHVEELCKIFLHEARIFACYTGMTDISVSTSILNGCEILISTPTLLVHLLRENVGLDLRNLNTFVIDDCERIAEVYQNELKFCLLKVKQMLKCRANKEIKVQYVVTSRIWCDFMSSLAKKAPDSVVCIAAFQECILYSKVDTSVEFLKKESKIEALLKFLKDIDKSKKTVIVCRSDDEVNLIEKILTSSKYVVFACDSNMTVHDLYSLDLALSEYQEPLLGPILVCCDGNLIHLNITDAHYLVHFSLPELFSMFCKRFAVLSDNYDSIFDNKDSNVKVKILLDDTNVEQLPKILNFIKRCSANVPKVLDLISDKVMIEKDIKKAKSFVPLCNALLTLGKCPDIWNCKQRHSIFQEFDEPKPWVPREGVVIFKILHYNSAVHYSARMISCISKDVVKKFPQTYSTIPVKLGMYYSKEINRKLHGRANPGDICGVSLKLNLFARCQVVKVLNYTQNNLPSIYLINLIDEEKYELARDTCLYYLPDELKNIETYAVQVILSNIAPEDRDITYSKLAENHLKKITETNEDLYMRGQVSLVIGNCIFVETLEACQDLSSLNETIVNSNFRNDLLDGHAILNPDHIKTLEKLGENLNFMCKKPVYTQAMEIHKPIKILPKARWAHLESDSYDPVYYLYAKSPGLFFVQHVKFQDCLNILLKDIKKYVTENPDPVTNIEEGDIVIAEFPDDQSYERARIDSVIDNSKFKCFFLDLGDWAVVSVNKLLPVTEKIITQLPFQAIECRLVGIKPVGKQWSEFSTNWLVDQFYDNSTNLKYLYAKRFTKEKAEYTDGVKYGIGLIDTYADDVCINKLMIDANLAEENEEIEFLNTMNIERDEKAFYNDSDDNEEINLHGDSKEQHEISKKKKTDSSDAQRLDEKIIEDVEGGKMAAIEPLALLSKQLGIKGINRVSKLENSVYDCDKENKPLSSMNANSTENISNDQQTIMKLFRKNPLRSLPLVEDDDFDDDKWDTSNPLLMLTNSKKISGPEPADRNDFQNITQAVRPAICYSQEDTQPLMKDEYAVNDEEQRIQLASTVNKCDDYYLSPTSAVSESSNESPLLADCIKNAKSDLIPNDTVSKLESLHNKRNDSYWTVLESNNTLLLHDEISSHMFKELKLTWFQDNEHVSIKIHVTTKVYELDMKDKELKFYTNLDDVAYGFEFELYGIIDVNKIIHSNKSTYIEIKLKKVMSKNWLTLIIGKARKIMSDDIGNTNISGVSNKNVDDKNLPKVTSPSNNVASTKVEVKEDLRKPKLIWHQNRSRVTIKIQLITDKYYICIKDKKLQFLANANDEEYGFDLELYGVVDVSKCCHSNRGQYIQVNLFKVMPKNWFTLCKGPIKKWIVYDVDGIEVSSEEGDDCADYTAHIRNHLNANIESESDDDFNDDTNFAYRKNY